MTFNDDMLKFQQPDGSELNISCKLFGVDWPPPEVMGPYTRLSFSQITDTERSMLTNVFRGALYKRTDSAS